jgi:predicted SAM-dependent methyltransferase
MREAIKALKRSWLGGPAIATYRKLHRLHRGTTGLDRRIIGNYLAHEGAKKLQLGCGKNPLSGWLNSDFFPKPKDVIHIDATQRFPFEDGTFDYVFSEHMIEHIPYGMGHAMLTESWRVLKVGGKIRVSTPDLAFLIALYQDDKSALQEEYIRFSSEYCKAAFCADTFVINNFVRDWGHAFIYDEKVLRFTMETAGFRELTRFTLNASNDAALQDLENEGRYPEGFLRLETLTLEGTKVSTAN